MEKEEIKHGYTRISDVLDPFKDFANIDPEVLANAARRGTAVHKYCELFISNMLFIDVADDCVGYIESFKIWLETVNPSPICLEERLYCEKRKITGQFDLLAKIGDDTVLVDIKTSSKPALSWDLQTAAYNLLIEEQKNVTVDNRMCLMLSKTGKKPRTIYFEDTLKKINMFENALELYRFFEKDKE